MAWNGVEEYGSVWKAVEGAWASSSSRTHSMSSSLNDLPSHVPMEAGLGGNFLSVWRQQHLGQSNRKGRQRKPSTTHATYVPRHLRRRGVWSRRPLGEQQQATKAEGKRT